MLGPTVLDEIILPEVVPVELMTCLSKDWQNNRLGRQMKHAKIAFIYCGLVLYERMYQLEPSLIIVNCSHVLLSSSTVVLLSML